MSNDHNNAPFPKSMAFSFLRSCQNNSLELKKFPCERSLSDWSKAEYSATRLSARRAYGCCDALRIPLN